MAVEGRKLRRLTGDVVRATSTVSFVYYVDAESFEPVSGESRISTEPDAVSRFRVLTYERLPSDPALLKIAATASTTIRRRAR